MASRASRDEKQTWSTDSSYASRAWRSARTTSFAGGCSLSPVGASGILSKSAYHRQPSAGGDPSGAAAGHRTSSLTSPSSADAARSPAPRRSGAGAIVAAAFSALSSKSVLICVGRRRVVPPVSRTSSARAPNRCLSRGDAGARTRTASGPVSPEPLANASRSESAVFAEPRLAPRFARAEPGARLAVAFTESSRNCDVW